eukprot:TRINITY_DN15380_c0_g1_i1.p1 TRINITY_DN15380_c0_g1~~TRINITY_DN15380_c0_g1_i1.p1  ORF type:complete len:217 (+),score=28.32 TRINITY_DN15380_c0_g1_i1:67-717(+)
MLKYFVLYISLVFFFFKDTATTEIYTLHIVGSVRCVQETGINAEYMGATIVVHDGKEGFPVEWLETEPVDERPSLRVLNGTLWVKSPYAAEHLQDWYCSEDKVEIRGGRVVIIGRENSDIINVGGSKISASVIVNVLQSFPGVMWCKVYGKKSPITGSIVVADVVFNPEFLKPGLEEMLIKFCREKQLDELMIPRIWRFPEAIPMGNNLKVNIKSE